MTQKDNKSQGYGSEMNIKKGRGNQHKRTQITENINKIGERLEQVTKIHVCGKKWYKTLGNAKCRLNDWKSLNVNSTNWK